MANIERRLELLERRQTDAGRLRQRTAGRRSSSANIHSNIALNIASQRSGGRDAKSSSMRE